VGAELFDADRQTDRETYLTKLIVAFRNFANAPKNSWSQVFRLTQLVHSLTSYTGAARFPEKSVSTYDPTCFLTLRLGFKQVRVYYEVGINCYTFVSTHINVRLLHRLSRAPIAQDSG
jgi:hypothetical protein